jgi:hypothetical protein
MDYASTYKFRVAYDRQVYISKNGRSTRIRTLDPLVPNQMRYQAALHSETGADDRNRTCTPCGART